MHGTCKYRQKYSGPYSPRALLPKDPLLSQKKILTTTCAVSDQLIKVGPSRNFGQFIRVSGGALLGLNIS